MTPQECGQRLLQLPPLVIGRFWFPASERGERIRRLIQQIPEVVYGVTTERTRRAATPLGPVSLHQVAPRFCCGYDTVEYGINLATPEKALVDTLYLTPARSHLFRALPEFELPRGFKLSVARRYLDRIDSLSRRTIVAQRLKEIYAHR